MYPYCVSQLIEQSLRYFWQAEASDRHKMGFHDVTVENSLYQHKSSLCSNSFIHYLTLCSWTIIATKTADSQHDISERNDGLETWTTAVMPQSCQICCKTSSSCSTIQHSHTSSSCSKFSWKSIYINYIQICLVNPTILWRFSETQGRWWQLN